VKASAQLPPVDPDFRLVECRPEKLHAYARGRARAAWAPSGERLGLCRRQHHACGPARRISDASTVKPVALVADAIKDCSRRGGLVLDPFCGSGTISRGRSARPSRPTLSDSLVRSSGRGFRHTQARARPPRGLKSRASICSVSAQTCLFCRVSVLSHNLLSLGHRSSNERLSLAQ
jgi:DNA methylase